MAVAPAASAATGTAAATPAGGSHAQLASLYVGDLHPELSEAQLHEMFSGVGPVASIRVCRDSVTRQSLGYAYVNFQQAADAERALDTLNNSTIKGRPVRIMWSHRDPALRKSGNGNIFVKNLEKNIDNKSLYDTFSLFGNILSCKVATDGQGQSRGYGFVHYESEDSAKQAIERVNGMQIGEKTVFVGPFVKRQERLKDRPENFTNVYVKHFPKEWEEEQVKELLEGCGEITSMAVMTDAKARKFAFVNFKEFEEAKKAVDTLHGKKMAETVEGEEPKEGDHLYVQRAMSKAERQQSLRAQYSTTDRTVGVTRGVNLYIKNLDDGIDDEKLKELFTPFGDVTSAKVMMNEQSESRGFGFVCFSNPDEAAAAVADMHLKLVQGKPLYVGLAEKREQRVARLQSRYRTPGAGMQAGAQMMGGGVYFSAPGVQNMMLPRPGTAGGVMMPMARQMAVPGGGVPGYPYTGMPGYGYNPQMMAGIAAAAAKGGKGFGMGMPPFSFPAAAAAFPMAAKAGGKGQQAAGQAAAGQQAYRYTSQARGPMPQAIPAVTAAGAVPLSDDKRSARLDTASLAAASPAVQKQIIGEHLFPRIQEHQPMLAGKITGMMLEMDNTELLALLESDNQLQAKVDEALAVLEQAPN